VHPDQPQTIGGVLDTTFRLYKVALVPLIPLSVLLTVASTPISIYQMINTDPRDPASLVAMATSPGYWITYVLSMIAIVWVMGALYLRANSVGSGETVSVGAALGRSVARVPVLIASLILFLIALTVGLILLLIPGVILMISLMLSFNLAVVENKGPLDSLLGSHRLVWGNWWRSAAILTVGFVIVAVIYVMAGILMAFFVPFFAQSENPFLAGQIAGILVAGLMGVLVTPFYISLLVALYWDLKLRKEGTDLAARVGALSAA
jgi:hypothetical protein